MDKAKEFLAEEVLVEQKVITYRYLSRALGIHVNVAKRALFDFHTSQNAKKPDSLHATYLLFGTKAADAARGHDEGDIDMEGSVAGDVPHEHVATSFLTLVSEKHLEDALATFETLEAIHVYSVSSQPTTDLQLLADSTRQLHELSGPAAADGAAHTLGTITNSHVRRRQRKGQAPAVAAAAAGKTTKLPPKDEPKAGAARPAAATQGPASIMSRFPAKAAKPTAAADAAEAAAASPAQSGTDAKKPAPPAAAAAAAAATAAPPSLKKAGSSSGSSGGIMQAFAKGASAPKPKKREPLQPAKKKEADEEDTLMGLSDDGGDDGNDGDDDGDDEAGILPKAQPVAGGKSLKERQEVLLKMMEDDDDDADAEGNDSDSEARAEDEREDTPMGGVDEPAAEPAATNPAKTEGPSEVLAATTGDGRRRGKRRVMRKKMIKDESGYLVTIQEPGWESFSEDEAPPPKAAVRAPAAAPKPKKPAPKTGQGNIMSFFAKK